MLSKYTTTQIAIQTKALADLLETVSIGDIVTFDDMSKVLGQDVRKIRYVLENARTKILAENGLRFDSVYKIGLKRMNIEDAIGVSDRNIKKIRRTARLASKRVNQQLSRANAVDDATRFALNARLSLFGTIETLASQKTVREVEKVSDERILPFGKVLSLFTQRA